MMCSQSLSDVPHPKTIRALGHSSSIPPAQCWVQWNDLGVSQFPWALGFPVPKCHHVLQADGKDEAVRVFRNLPAESPECQVEKVLHSRHPATTSLGEKLLPSLIWLMWFVETLS